MPRPGVLPLFVTSYSLDHSAASIGRLFVSNPGIAASNWVANTSIFCPVFIPWAYPVNRVFWVNGSTITTSNANFGIFLENGDRIYATGSTALAGANITQFVTPTPFLLPPGRYYFTYSCDNTTARFCGTTSWTALMLRQMGVQEQTSNFALADPATLAAPTNALYPMCGITRTVSGY